MGAGASAGFAAGVKAASEKDLADIATALPDDAKEKLRKALEASAPAAGGEEKKEEEKKE